MRAVATLALTRYFLYATVVSFCAAVAFTVPVIVPEFTFPLELTVWPGTWMFEAYFAFLIVGVLGNLGWAVLLDLFRRNADRESSPRYVAFTHLALSNIGVYGATGFMFAVGYLGGAGALAGFGRAVITQSIIGWMVVPIGVFIYLYVIASVFGVANLVGLLGKGGGVDETDREYRRSDLIFWGTFASAVSAVFVILPILEIPFYPNNYIQELSIMGVSGVAFLTGVVLAVYGGLRGGSVAMAIPPKGEPSATA